MTKLVVLAVGDKETAEGVIRLLLFLEREISYFADLVVRMRNIDPTRRATAKEALAHRCFSDVP